MKHDPLDLKGQEKKATESERERKHALDVAAGDFKWLMSDKRGRRIVWKLLESTGVFRSSFTGNSETFFREGARNVGLMLMSDINTHAPDAYVLMLEESKAK